MEARICWSKNTKVDWSQACQPKPEEEIKHCLRRWSTVPQQPLLRTFLPWSLKSVQILRPRHITRNVFSLSNFCAATKSQSCLSECLSVREPRRSATSRFMGIRAKRCNIQKMRKLSSIWSSVSPILPVRRVNWNPLVLRWYQMPTQELADLNESALKILKMQLPFECLD